MKYLGMFGGVIMLLLLTEPHGFADQKQAQRLYEEGVEAYNLGRFEQAISAFSNAYQQSPAPEFLFNIAQSHRQLGHCRKALFFYRRFQQIRPQAPQNEEIEDHIRTLSTTCSVSTPPRHETPPSSTAPEPQPPSVTPSSKVSLHGSPASDWLVIRIDTGIEHIFAGSLNIPVQPTVSLGALHPFATDDDDDEWGLGLRGAWTPVPYRGDTSQTAYLLELAVEGSWETTIAPWLRLQVALGGGLLWFAGLKSGNPFTVDQAPASGPLGLGTVHSAVQLSIPLTSSLQLTLIPTRLTWSPRHSGFDDDIDSVLRWSLRGGVRYRL